MTGRTDESRAGHRRGRRRWFRVAAILLAPVLVLGVLELGMSIAGTGHSTAFLVPASGAEGWLHENPRFGWSFFPRAIARRPQPVRLQQRDAVTSSASPARRVFVLGGSAAMGDPTPAYGMVRMLEVMLAARYPEHTWEVVNASMTAINSHVLPDIARSCAAAGADLFIVYVGNNEVVGPYGPGTVLGSFAGSRTLIRASLAAKRTHLGQFITGRSSAGGDDAPGDWAGMEMFLDKQVRASDPRMEAVYSHFAANLREVCSIAGDAGAPVLLCTVAANLADCPPFASLHRDRMGMSEVEQWDALIDEGRTSEDAGALEEALGCYRRAVAVDPEHAEGRYLLGRCLLRLGRPEEARPELEAARDQDTLRFRVDSRLNGLLRELPGQIGTGRVLGVDTEAAVAGACSAGVPGAEALYEHVHMNFQGNYQIARALVEAVPRALPDLGPGSGSVPTIDECRGALALTAFDEVETRAELLQRMARPPFTNQRDHLAHMIAAQREVAGLRARLETSEGHRAVKKAYELSIAGHPDDWVLRYRFAGYLQARQQGREALAQLAEVARLLPHYEEVYHLMAVTHAQLGETDAARGSFEHTLELCPEHVLAHYNYAQFLASQHDTGAAEEQVDVALDLNPGLAAAWAFLGSLLAGQERFDEAADAYGRAAELRPESVSDRLGHALTLLRGGHRSAAADAYRAAAELARKQGQTKLVADIEKRLAEIESGR